MFSLICISVLVNFSTEKSPVSIFFIRFVLLFIYYIILFIIICIPFVALESLIYPPFAVFLSFIMKNLRGELLLEQKHVLIH